jgi:hypothetical protein
MLTYAAAQEFDALLRMHTFGNVTNKERCFVCCGHQVRMLTYANGC